METLGRVVVAAVLAVGGLLLCGSRVGQAAALVVTTCGGNSATAGSLPYEISHAQAGDSIGFSVNCPAAGPIKLDSGSGGSGQISVSANLSIDGSGAQVVISGENTTGIFAVSPGVSLGINDLTLEKGSYVYGGAISNNQGMVNVTNSTFLSNAAPQGQGGAIECYGARLSVSESTFTNNVAGSGGAIYTDGGTADMTGSTLSGNSASVRGGAIESTGGGWTFTNSTLSGNSAPYGGAIDQYAGTVNLTGSNLSGNSASTSGGAIYANGGTVNVTNSTLSGNSASLNGGAINNFQTLNVADSTLSANSAQAGGAVDNNDRGAVSLFNTILAGSTGGTCVNSVNSTINDGGNNLEFVTGTTVSTCNLTSSSDVVGKDPLLGPLQDNGGPTSTQALGAGSPAADAGNGGICAQSTITAGSITFPGPANLDQRGMSRYATTRGACDIGAYDGYYERNVAPAHLVVTAPGAPAAVGTPVTIRVTAEDAGGALLSGYRDTVHVTSSDPQAGLPADYTFTAADSGIHDFTVTFQTVGTQTVTVTDIYAPSVTGSASLQVGQAMVTVQSGAGWNLVGGSPLTLWTSSQVNWSWNAFTGQWYHPTGNEAAGAGTWEYVPAGGPRGVLVSPCSGSLSVPVVPHRWNLVGNPCSQPVVLPPGTRALWWDPAARSYAPITAIPAGLAAWVNPSLNPISLTPST